MGAHDFKYSKMPLFDRKTGNINTSMLAAPKLARVPASRYYCDVTWSYIRWFSSKERHLVKFDAMVPHLNLFQSK